MRCPDLLELALAPPDRTGWPWVGQPSKVPARVQGDDVRAPRVTIITPSYNHGAFLEETIRSVLLQGYPDLEYVIVDGGSTDDSVEIIRKYEPWLTFWTSEPDHGQSDAINRGLRRATGDIVAWLNSDDTYKPGAVWRAVQAFQQNPEAAMVYGGSAVCDEAGNPVGRVQGRKFDIEELIWGRNPVPQPSAFLRRQALQEVGLLDETLHFALDFDLWMRLGTACRAVFVDEVWSNFRYYPESKSGMGRLPFLNEIHRVLERTFAAGKLPVALLKQRDAALSRSLARMAWENHRLGRDRAGRVEMVKALRLHPFLLMHASWRPRVIRCLMGRRWLEWPRPRVFPGSSPPPLNMAAEPRTR